MPFTPAHPAWLFPFRTVKKLNISWTALLIGSMVPDLEYFIWLSPAAYCSHTFSGIFVFNLPLTFILAFLWHHSLANALFPRLAFLNRNFQAERISDFPEWLKKNIWSFLLCSLTGICSHLIWDSFCHANGYMVHRIPFLLDFTKIRGYDVRNCYIVWYLSTLIGLIIMSFWLVDFKKLFSAVTWKVFFTGSSFWGKILFVAGSIAIARIALGLSWNWTRHLVVIAMGSAFYGTIIVCYWDQWISVRNKKKRAS